MPSYGNATIGEVPDSIYGANYPVQLPVAINAMPLVSSGMANAHIGQNYNVQEPDPKRAELLAADGTPGLNGSANRLVWSVATGTWGPAS